MDNKKKQVIVQVEIIINWIRKEKSVYVLKNIQLLENQISEIIVSYYIPIPLKINGIKVNMSLFDLMQLIISDYKIVVLKDFYEGLD